MSAVLNAILSLLKWRGLRDYMDHVYHDPINVQSKEDNKALSGTFYQRFGYQIVEDTFA